MNELTNIHAIDPTALRQGEYLVSLLTEARRCGLLPQAEVERFQMDSLSLLAIQSERYNGGASSSIRVEKAQELLAGVYYTVGAALKACPTPEAALELLRQESLTSLFEAGQRRIQRKLHTARLLHRRLKRELFATPTYSTTPRRWRASTDFSSCTARRCFRRRHTLRRTIPRLWNGPV